MTRNYPAIGVQTPTVYFPRAGVDHSKWAVVACDQYTSQPEYWQEVAEIVGDHPSTLRLTFPEVWLGKEGEAERIQSIQDTMRSYLSQGLLVPQEGMVYVERTITGKTRKGLVLCLDLEQYDYTRGSRSLIRATEGTIMERLPPRMKIREGAVIEIPHILVLIDDPRRTVIEPLAGLKDRLIKRYEFELMLGGGWLAGWQIQDATLEANIIQGLEKLAEPGGFVARYTLNQNESVMLFAMGDGNHSLATAKAIWEKIKAQAGGALALDHPARYALVEIENVHDEALEFEPIHRVLFGVGEDLIAAMQQYYGLRFSYHTCRDAQEMQSWIGKPTLGKQSFGLALRNRLGVVEIADPPTNLAVGTLQPFLDEFLKSSKVKAVDYVHGNEVVFKLAAQPGNAGFLLPPMAKSDLFKTVVLDGALPRKTFSLGEAHEKRYYMESRKITH